MFRSGHVIRHIGTYDMDLFIAKVQYRGDAYTKLRVYYLDRRSGKFIWPDPSTITIYHKDKSNWKVVT